jgi:hypothetical protein
MLRDGEAGQYEVPMVAVWFRQRLRLSAPVCCTRLVSGRREARWANAMNRCGSAAVSERERAHYSWLPARPLLPCDKQFKDPLRSLALVVLGHRREDEIIPSGGHLE